MALHYFKPLVHSELEQLQHAAYLKGLLQPFKGKGCLEDWASDCNALRDGLIELAQTRILTQARRYPFNLLAAQLTRHRTGAGTTFLRWRNPDRTNMGVSLWQQCIEHEATPNLLIDDLYALEQQRIVLNMQISMSHILARQASDCAIKMSHAEAVYQRCIQQRALV